MRIVFTAMCWAGAILVLALGARFGWIDRKATDLLLMVLPMIAFVTLLGGRDCRATPRGA